MVDLGDRTLLVVGQPERKRGAIPGDELSCLAERRRNLRLSFASAKRKTDLQQQQLVEGQSCAGALGFGERTGTVQRPQRVCPFR